jgi:citrate lyase beta subunit
MIKSYFFIPGDHYALLEKLRTIKSNYLIIDLEDSLKGNKIDFVLQLLTKVIEKEDKWIRPRLFVKEHYNEKLLKELVRIGFRNFLLPKLYNYGQLKEIEKSFDVNILKKINFSLLVENPECLMNLQNIINNSTLNIVSIGFGSQDYCNASGMSHSNELLKFPRFIISNTAKAFGIDCIDIACMDIHNNDAFQNEIKDSIMMGYDGKFIIHPKQLEILNNYEYYSETEILESQKILAEYERQGKPNVFVYNGIAVEPPHIEKYQYIINKSNINGNK